MNKLSWIFELIDRVSGPADAASKAIDRVDGSMRRANVTSSGMGSRISAAGASFSRFTMAVLPTIVALGQIANAGILVSNAMKLMGVNTATLRAGFDAIKGGAARAVASIRAFGSRALAALRRIPPSAYVAAAAVAGIGLAAYGAKRALSAILSPLRSLASAALSAAPYIAIGSALLVAKGALDGMISRQRTLMGLEIASGRGGEGSRIYERARRLSEQLGTDLNETFGSVQNLMSKGLGEEQVFALVQGMADITTLSPDANLQRMALAIGQIQQAGVLQGDELNQLAESGLPLEHVYERIGAAMGVAASEVRGLRGTVPAAVALQAILGGIADTTGSDLGGVAEQMSHTLGGEIERLRQAPDRFFERVAAGSGETSERLTSAVRRLNEFLNPESAQGARVVAMLSRALESLATWLDSATQDTSKFDNALAGIVAVGQITMFLFEGLGGIVNGLSASFALARATAVGFYDLLAGTPAAVSGALESVLSSAQSLVTSAFEIGRNIVTGLVNGLVSMQFAPVTAITNMGASMITALRTALGIHSPSRVFAYLGEMTGLGFNEGLESSGMGIGLNGEMQAPALGSPQAMAALGGATINLTINVNGSDDDRETADTIGEIVMSRLAQAFDSLALETGV